MTEKTKSKTEGAPKANVIFVGKKQKLNKETGRSETVRREAPAFVIDYGEKIDLPDGIEKGVHVEPETVERLCSLFPSDFKRYEPRLHFATDLPKDFPVREILRGHELNLADVRKLDRDALIALSGIGEPSADKILKFLSEVKK